MKCSQDTVLFVCLCHNRSEKQAVGIENDERRRIRGNYSAYDKGLLYILYDL